MYIRTKTRTNASGKSYTYAYLAQIKQRRSHPKQKIVKYLGRVYKEERTSNKAPNVSDLSYQEMIENLIKTELENHNFQEVSPKLLKKGDIAINLDQSTVINTKKNKPVCIQLNQGMLCNTTLKNMLAYQPPKEGMKQISQHFAKTIVEAGIQPSQPIIVEIFKKIQTMINNKQQRTTSLKDGK